MQDIPLINQTPFSAELLGRLFTMLSFEVAPDSLAQAVTLVNQRTPVIAPVERVGQILNILQRTNMRAALISWGRFNRRGLPALVFVDGEWCIAQRDDNGAIGFSSATGALKAPQDEDLEDAQVLWLRTNEKRETVSSLATMASPAVRMILTELFASKRWLWEVLVATLVINLLAVATSLYSMQVYDRVVPAFSYATLWALSVGMFIAMVADWLLKYVRARMLDNVAKIVDKSTSQRLFEHLLSLRLDSRPRSVGSLAAQASGLESARSFFSSTIVFAVTDMPFALMFIGFVGVVGGKVALVYLLLLPLAIGMGWLAQLQLRRLSKGEIQRSTERQGLLVETIQGAEVIQSLGAGWRFADNWRGVTSSMADYNLKNRKITSIMSISAGALGNLAYVLAIVVGVHGIEAGELTTGGLVASTILGGRILGPVTQAVQILAQWQHVRESLDMVNRLLGLEKNREDNKLLLAPDQRPDSLVFEGVRFSYPQSPIVRLDIPDLSLQAGERVLLLGGVGSGKSTLLKVAAGLYRAGEGRIRLGGADIWEIDPQVMVEHVAYLPQDVQLFKGTLRSNLSMVGAVGDGRLLEVCRSLGIDRIAADDPRSMDTEISEGGQGISGGQRQLIGLGRTLLAQPQVWLLDEPTASLDSESETRVLQALEQCIKPDDIVLIATHRSSLIKLATRVLVMRSGKVVMDAPPDQVLKGMSSKPSSSATDNTGHENAPSA